MEQEKVVVERASPRTIKLLDALQELATTRRPDWWVYERRAFSFRITTHEGGTFVVSVAEVD